MRNTSDPGLTKYMTLVDQLFQHKNQKGKKDASASIRLLMSPTADATDPNLGEELGEDQIETMH